MSLGEDTIASLGEDRVIELFAPSGGALGEKIVVPNGDDAAAYFVEPRYVSVVTTDTMVERVHFELSHGPALRLGRKLMAVNLSDIAAMGASPRYALISVCFPKSTPIGVVEAIAEGVQASARSFGVAIIGGNVTSSPGPIVLAATLIGRADPEQLIRRRGTQAGDAIFVTGQLGHARAGLLVLNSVGPVEKSDPRMTLVSALTDPKPRVAAGRALARTHLVHAMCDVSDGLGRDLRHLLEPESLGARIDASTLPTSAALRGFCQSQGFDLERTALEGGEDYELLFTAHPRDSEAIVSTCAAAGTPVSRIGMVTPDPSFEVLNVDGEVEGLPGGYDHF